MGDLYLFTHELDIDRVNMNCRAKYLGYTLFGSGSKIVFKNIVRTHTKTARQPHTTNRLLTTTREWLVVNER